MHHKQLPPYVRVSPVNVALAMESSCGSNGSPILSQLALCGLDPPTFSNVHVKLSSPSIPKSRMQTTIFPRFLPPSPSSFKSDRKTKISNAKKTDVTKQEGKKIKTRINSKAYSSRCSSVHTCGLPFLLYLTRASRYCPCSGPSGHFGTFGLRPFGPLGAVAGGALRFGSCEGCSCHGGGGDGRPAMGRDFGLAEGSRTIGEGTSGLIGSPGETMNGRVVGRVLG